MAELSVERIVRCVNAISSAAERDVCHIYTDSDDVLYAGKNFICIHASTDGEKKIKLPKSCSLNELYEKRYYSHDSSDAAFNMECGETLTFEIR